VSGIISHGVMNLVWWRDSVKVASDDEGALPRVSPARGPLPTPAFQEELVRRESGQRASSITDSM
jgi:hypothetical protein